jgi:hypothetical protein
MAQRNAVKWLKEMSRERVRLPRTRFVPDKRKSEQATREEQCARYLDSGWNDDRGESND